MAELFCGIGGFRLGFDQACKDQKIKSKVVFKSEIDTHCINNYIANFKEDSKDFFDIDKIDLADINDHDLLTAGFPCQPFSTAGLQKGFEDQRGNFYINIYKVLKYKRPKAFLLENVKGLLFHDKGKTFKTIIETLESLNYRVHYKVFCASDYKLQQRRKRIFIVGFKDRDIKFFWPTPLFNDKKVWDILEPKVSDDYTITNISWRYHQKRREQYEKTGNGFHYNISDKKTKLAATLVSTYNKCSSTNLVKQEGKNPRRFTPRECARLQGFPDNFILQGSKSQLYKQLGNSVPVPIVKAICIRIILALKGER